MLRYSPALALAPVLALATATVLSGCHQAAPDRSTVAAAASADPGACAVALAPDAAAGQPDVARLQGLVRARGGTLAYLEQLGWRYVRIAREQGDAGYYTLALATADCVAAEPDPASAAALLRAHVYLQQHRFAEAQLLAQRLVAERGLWLDHALLGDTLLEQGELDAAAGAYQAAADLRPGPEMYARIAQLRWLTGDLQGAIDFLVRSARATPAADRAATAWAQTRLSTLVLQSGDAAAALQLATTAVRLAPTQPAALAAEGRALLALDRPAEALAVLERAAGQSRLPEHQWWWLEAAHAAGDSVSAAVASAALAATGAATDPRSYALYLATLGAGSGATEAVALARAELARRADVHSHDALAWAAFQAGDVATAAAESQRALAHGTADARLWLHAALIARANGAHEQAAAALDRAAAGRAALLPSERSLLGAALATFNQTHHTQTT
jgi:Flp pilus assembly protein TadD